MPWGREALNKRQILTPPPPRTPPPPFSTQKKTTLRNAKMAIQLHMAFLANLLEALEGLIYVKLFRSVLNPGRFWV